MKTAAVFVGQFPPPLTGFTLITQRLADVLPESYKLKIVDISGAGERGLPFHILRAFRTLRAAALIARLRRTHPIVYVACDGGLGLAYALLLTVIARLSGMQFYLHHHSYAYIEARNALMAALLAICGEQATHIVLAPEMGQSLANRYRRRLRVAILPNIALIPRVADPPRKVLPSDVLTVGLLGNLCAEKGLSTFLAILRKAKLDAIPLHGVLAGPVSRASDREDIASAMSELTESLEYRGPVYGDEKTSFYADIDVFLFPTRYANEAQPLVIFEALEWGRPVITTERGCIGSQVAGGGIVIEKTGDVIEKALAQLTVYARKPEALRANSAAARASAARHRLSAEYALPALFDAPCRVLYPARCREHQPRV